MNNRTRDYLSRTLLAGASAIAIASAAAPAAAQDATKAFDIPAQPLSSALIAYSQQADTPVIASMDLLKGKAAPQVKGDMPQQQALAMLLEGSGLRAVQGASGGLVVERVSQDPQGGSAAGGGATVEALIVTAQKREEDIQDVPIAISAFSQEDLTRSQIAGGPDLITQVPNMTFTKTNFSSYSVQIRGIGTQAISATTDPAVAVAFNNTPFIRNRFFEQEFYDLQRVEVLRGPQGTLYGRNATAGVVNIISAKPKFFFEAKVSADIANYSSTRVEAMANIPLVEDVVALRLAGAWTKRDGFAFNQITGSPIDGRDLWSTRVSLRFAPTDRIEANLIWEHFEEDDDRLRSGKQLCKKDVVTHIGGYQVTDYFDKSNDGSGNAGPFAGVQATFSQGCKRNSLYANNSFQRPNGLMLPYYAPLDAVGLPAALTDPYVSVVNTSNPFLIDTTNDQLEDLRAIESTIDPQYTARSDLGELQISFDLTDRLSLQSETAYATDQVRSLQDFNRFNTAPGAFSTTNGNGSDNGLVGRGILTPDGEFCDPQLGCSDRLIAVDISTAKAWQFSQELRLASDYDGPFNFSIGANFLRADSEDKYYVFINSLSLIVARNGGEGTYSDSPYVNGETDNRDCLRNQYLEGDPDEAYSVTRCAYIDPNPIDRVNDKGHNYFLSRNPYSLISYAVFGEAYYNITDTLKVTAGLRWTVDKKDAPRIPSWILASHSVGYPVAEVIRQEWREPTGRLALDWRPDLSFTDETLIYGSYAHGYKAGGANPPGYVRVFYADSSVADQSAAVSATRPKTFKPEFVDAFELGAKNTLLGGSLTLNAAAFYYDYKGYQVSEIVDRSAFNRNFDAEVWGAEIEADWRALENLRFGFKAGYQKSRIADGEEAIDLMDRTAGNPDWLLVRPFPTYASSCIVPTYIFVNPDNTLGKAGKVGGGGPGVCEIAYLQGLDPVTNAPFGDPPGPGSNLNTHPGYPGWDPTLDYGNNGGEGFTKPLGGNELPNAPNWTATITGDYTLPLAGDWLVNLHTDLHWQSQSYWRVFQDSDFSTLDEFYVVNLAAIFTNEEVGWNIMAYVKNVTDETAITGAFLNSDDTGLTTNVFLTEPRLYGIRVTKRWEGGPLLGSFGERGNGPYPLTVELGGQIQRVDAPNELIDPPYASAFPAPLDIYDDPQGEDLDWGDGREVKLTYRAEGSPWAYSAGLRTGSVNGFAETKASWDTEPLCLFGGFVAVLCTLTEFPPGSGYEAAVNYSQKNHAEAYATDGESHEIFDLEVRRDVEVAGLSRSALGFGLRHVQLDSGTQADLYGVPDWYYEAGSFKALVGFTQGPVTHTAYDVEFEAKRDFEGVGPTLTWDAALPLLDLQDSGRVDLDWSATAGVLFGDRETSISGHQELNTFQFTNFVQAVNGNPELTGTTVEPPVSFERSDNATVPLFEGALGLTYSVGRVAAGVGYRWERYFDAIDGGYVDAKDEDRTIDGPYFKLSVGFGG